MTAGGGSRAAGPLLENGAVTEAGLEAAAPETLVALLRDRIAAVREALPRLEAADDPEALHDFRVALRRVRSLLRAYWPVLRGPVGRRLRRRLRRIARASGPSRDLEVKLEWLGKREAELRPRDRIGARWLHRRLTDRKTRIDRRAARRIGRDATPALEDLEAALTSLERDPPTATPTLAVVTGVRLGSFTERLAAEFDRVGSIADQDEAHATRIAGKRIRYLLEPLAATVPGAADLVPQLKALQDLLGDMHDAHVAARMIAQAMEAAAGERGLRVAERVREGAPFDRAALRRERRRDPMPGLVALADLARERRESLWNRFERDWLRARSEDLLTPLERLADDLASRISPADLEIERKYLLSAVPERALAVPPRQIEQGWLPGDRIQERLRRTVAGDGVQRHRTIKLGTGVIRTELEDQVDEALFDALWPLTEGRRVRKRRYVLEADGLTWEIDQFEDQDLVLAEVELPSEHAPVGIPDWLRPLVIREVTGEAEYLNVNLAG